MSNDTVPVLEHIYDEEHKKAECCIELIDTKTVSNIIYYIFVRNCKCKKSLKKDKFWHTKKLCTYSKRLVDKGFIIKEFCHCCGISDSSEK